MPEWNHDSDEDKGRWWEWTILAILVTGLLASWAMFLREATSSW